MYMRLCKHLYIYMRNVYIYIEMYMYAYMYYVHMHMLELCGFKSWIFLLGSELPQLTSEV